MEINPLAEGKYSNEPETVFCVDAKLNFDDNASFRQKDVWAMRDKSMEDPRDVRAEEAGLNFVGLDGNVGCLVNGAGLAMATMDQVNLTGSKYGVSPANYRDSGAGAKLETIAEAFRILTSDSKVKAILVNIFGGIMRWCVVLGILILVTRLKGIIFRHSEVGDKIHLVVRFEVTNVDIVEKLSKEAGDAGDASKKVVKAGTSGKTVAR